MKQFFSNTQEKQKEQSKLWLAQALLTLLEKDSFSDITISEICIQADLSRRTFYRHFNSKEELLCFYIERLCFSYNDLFQEESDRRLPNVTRIFFSFWLEHRPFLLLLKKNHLESLLFNTFSKLLPAIYQDSSIKPLTTPNMTSRYYISIFCSGGYALLLLHWLDHGCTDSPEFMAETIQNLIQMNL